MRRYGFPLALLVLLFCTSMPAQNLFTNPDFDSDASGWLLACGSNPTWITDDEAGCPLSGAVHVTSGPCQGLQGSGVAQCFPATEGAVLFAAGRVRAASGYALAAISTYPTTDCSGPPATTVNSPLDPRHRRLADDRLRRLHGPRRHRLGPDRLRCRRHLTAVDADIDAGYAGESPLVFHDDFEADSASAPPTCRWSSIAP